jgi:hypothetical protein
MQVLQQYDELYNSTVRKKGGSHAYNADRIKVLDYFKNELRKQMKNKQRF